MTITSTATEQELRSIFFTNVNGTGEDVMVFTRLTAEQCSQAFKESGKITFDECYEVPGSELQYYLYDPCYLSEAEEKKALEFIAKK